MNIRLRFSLILGSLVVGFCAVLLILRHFATVAQAEHREDFEREQAAFLAHWVNTDSRAWQRQAALLATQSAANFNGNPSAMEAWRFSASNGFQPWTENGNQASPPPLGAAFGNSLSPDGDVFWFYDGTVLRQAACAPLDENQWLMIVRSWTPDLLARFSELAGGTLSAEVNSAADKPQPTDRYTVSFPLHDWRGILIGELRLSGNAPVAQPLLAEAMLPTLLLVAFGFTLIIGLALSLRLWVLHPLSLIQQSLASGESDAIQPLRGRRDEMGAVANLLAESIAQRNALHESETNLQRALEERIRLGRDLHDSVIQSLYATGMSLSLVKNRLHADQSDITAKLEESRDALNETILDLRNFITGLEPEALNQQTFAQAVASVLATSGVETACEIDDAVAQRLTLSQRANILQITREAVSNALRHGQATLITVSLKAVADTLVFVIRDNGVGFDPKAPHHQGRGLANLSGRAQDMGARLAFDARPGHGVSLKLTFHLNPIL
ncbi:MAG: sensor histidine kinase [Opitutaceae bacterium]